MVRFRIASEEISFVFSHDQDRTRRLLHDAIALSEAREKSRGTSTLSILNLPRVFMTQVLQDLLLLVRRGSQMCNIEMPIGSIRNNNVAVRPMRVSDLVNFHVRRQNIYDYCVVQRNYAGADLFSSDK